MHDTVVNQNRYHASRINAQKPRRDMLMFFEINRVRIPIDVFLVQENTNLLRTGRGVEVKEVNSSPVTYSTACSLKLHISEYTRSEDAVAI